MVCCGLQPPIYCGAQHHLNASAACSAVHTCALKRLAAAAAASFFSDGLDWLVESAGARGLRLLLVLTNGGSSAGGGMQQYTHWVDPALTVVDFYGNDTVKVRTWVRNCFAVDNRNISR
eukprot:GHUV01033074.1.p1 GENE.GHUV01033074.1~~GHUV01033074.1.p1  ORF type:complete len:119 (+),score=39.32 GHUV01033074.1:77-433(+)